MDNTHQAKNGPKKETKVAYYTLRYTVPGICMYCTVYVHVAYIKKEGIPVFSGVLSVLKKGYKTYMNTLIICLIT